MGRRILNRKEMRNDFDAAERRTEDAPAEEEVEEEDDDDEEGAEEEEGAEAEESDEDEAEDSGDEEDDEDGEPKKKKKKKKVVKEVKPKAKSRARTPKIVRMRVVWGVFSNSHQMVATFDYPKKSDAEAHAAKLTADKKSTHFVQPVKQAIEEKETKEK